MSDLAQLEKDLASMRSTAGLLPLDSPGRDAVLRHLATLEENYAKMGTEARSTTDPAKKATDAELASLEAWLDTPAGKEASDRVASQQPAIDEERKKTAQGNGYTTPGGNDTEGLTADQRKSGERLTITPDIGDAVKAEAAKQGIATEPMAIKTFPMPADKAEVQQQMEAMQASLNAEAAAKGEKAPELKLVKAVVETERTLEDGRKMQVFQEVFAVSGVDADTANRLTAGDNDPQKKAKTTEVAQENGGVKYDQGQEAAPQIEKRTRSQAKLDRLNHRLEALEQSRSQLRDLANQARDTEKMTKDAIGKIDEKAANAKAQGDAGNFSKKAARDVVRGMKQDREDLKDTLTNARKAERVYDKAADGWRMQAKAGILEARIAGVEKGIETREQVREAMRQGVHDAAHGIVKGAEATKNLAFSAAKGMLSHLHITGGQNVDGHGAPNGGGKAPATERAGPG